MAGKLDVTHHDWINHYKPWPESPKFRIAGRIIVSGCRALFKQSWSDCRQPFRYAPERPTTVKARIARNTKGCATSIICEYANIKSMQDSLRRFKADIFQALAHPTRIAILEFLSAGELSAGALIEKLGMEQANVSQHLAVLRVKQLVSNRKSGNQVIYAVRDPIIIDVLNLMRTYFHAHLKESLGMLDEIEKPLETAR
jgi:DNA-binding transcriptional ArsR family regulator